MLVLKMQQMNYCLHQVVDLIISLILDEMEIGFIITNQNKKLYSIYYIFQSQVNYYYYDNKNHILFIHLLLLLNVYW